MPTETDREQEQCETALLRNGTREARYLVAATTLVARRLFKEHPVAFYELRELCRDETHVPFGTTKKVLADAMLVEERNGVWHTHESTRNIVLSACQGEGFEHMTIVNPLAEQKDG